MDWEHVADGVEVLKFSKVVAPQDKEPEIAILRLSGERYKQLHNSPKNFVNEFKVFSKSVREMTMEPSSSSLDIAMGTMTAAPQLVIVIHRPTCAAYGVAAAESLVAATV
jgi:hypothetical protein